MRAFCAGRQDCACCGLVCAVHMRRCTISAEPLLLPPATCLQYTWLQRDLALVNRDVTPWLIIMFHAPW